MFLERKEHVANHQQTCHFPYVYTECVCTDMKVVDNMKMKAGLVSVIEKRAAPTNRQLTASLSHIYVYNIRTCTCKCTYVITKNAQSQSHRFIPYTNLQVYTCVTLPRVICAV